MSYGNAGAPGGDGRHARPGLDEIHAVLATHRALIVHFSGTPKGGGSDYEHLYPADLEEVIAGRCNGGLSCSTVMPGDEFADLNRANATGCVGVILGLKAPQSILDAHRRDCGTFVQDGVRQVPHARDMNAADLNETIAARPADTYNEWVIGRYDVLGILAVPPYNVWTEQLAERPHDLPDYLEWEEEIADISTTTPAEIALLFPNLRVFSFRQNALVELVDEAWRVADHQELYPCS